MPTDPGSAEPDRAGEPRRGRLDGGIDDAVRRGRIAARGRGHAPVHRAPWQTRAEVLSWGLLGMTSPADIVTDRPRPMTRYPTVGPRCLALETPAPCCARPGLVFTARAANSMAAHVRRPWWVPRRGRRVFRLRNAIRVEASWPATAGRSISPASSRPTPAASARGRGRSRWPPCPATRAHHVDPTPPPRPVPGPTSRFPLDADGRREVPPGAPALSAAWLRRAELAGTRINDMVRGRGEVSRSRSSWAAITWTAGPSLCRTGDRSPWPTARTRSPTLPILNALANPPRLVVFVWYVHHVGGVGIVRSTHSGSGCAWRTAPICPRQAGTGPAPMPGHGRDQAPDAVLTLRGESPRRAASGSPMPPGPSPDSPVSTGTMRSAGRLRAGTRRAMPRCPARGRPAVRSRAAAAAAHDTFPRPCGVRLLPTPNCRLPGLGGSRRSDRAAVDRFSASLRVTAQLARAAGTEARPADAPGPCTAHSHAFPFTGGCAARWKPTKARSAWR